MSAAAFEWVFCCAGCRKLASSPDPDALTCSPACLERVHDDGRIHEFNALAAKLGLVDLVTGEPRPALGLQAVALKHLRPDLRQPMLHREMTDAAAMELVYQEFLKTLVDDPEMDWAASKAIH